MNMTRVAPGAHDRRTQRLGQGHHCPAGGFALGWHLLDSGALYRFVALAAVRRGISLEDEAAA